MSMKVLGFARLLDEFQLLGNSPIQLHDIEVLQISIILLIN